MVERQPSKLNTGVRFSSRALFFYLINEALPCMGLSYIICFRESEEMGILNNIMDIMENIRGTLPLFCICWGALILSGIFRPQSLFNSFLLLITLLVSLTTVISAFGSGSGTALTVFMLLTFLVLLCVPILLIWNGIVMLRRESFSAANLLSLVLGILIFLGEASFFYMALMSSSYHSSLTLNILSLFTFSSVFYFSVLILAFVLYSIFIQYIPKTVKFDYIIIHGGGLINGNKVPPLLASRIDKAIQIFHKSKDQAMIIPSGGKGPDETISEAAAMKQYLLDKGIPEDKILPEDQSTTTRENLIFSKKIIDSRPGGKRTALVTSNYHVYRCLVLAKSLKIKCIGIGAHVAPYYWPSAVLREFAAVYLNKKNLIITLIGYFFFVIIPVLSIM